MHIYDVAVVGAGPAGSSLSISLARQGLDVLLIDKAKFPRDKICGDFIGPKGLTILRQLGCWADILNNHSFPITHSKVHLNGTLLSESPIPFLNGMVNHGRAIPRSVLDEILFRKAQQLKVKTIENSKVDGYSYENNHVCLKTNYRGKTHKFFSRMIVGADGAHSVIARKSGNAMTDNRYILHTIRCYCYGLKLSDADLYFEDEFFPGFAWIFPVSSETANIGVGMVAEVMKKFGLKLNQFFKRLLDIVQRLSDDQGVSVKISRTKGWPIKTYKGTASNSFNRGILIGEAAGLVDPISGEGIGLALESGILAQHTILKAFEKGDFDLSHLSGWEHEWKTHFEPDLQISDLIVSLLRNRHFVKVWINSLRLICKCTQNDDALAWTLGGVLAGVLPNRDSLSLDVLLKLGIHGPRFWMEMLGYSKKSTPVDIICNVLEQKAWESETLSRVLRDLDWFNNWAKEIIQKQTRVFHYQTHDHISLFNKIYGLILVQVNYPLYEIELF